MVDLPRPPIDPDVDLRNFPYLPLDVVRLRDSDLAASPHPEVFRCAVLSWCVAWHQTPAGSLPDDDVILARLLGYGRDIRGWQRIRKKGGLRGWALHSDGRLYHPVVVEKAIESWLKNKSNRAKTEAARLAKLKLSQGQSQPLSQSLSLPLSQTESSTVTGSKGREGIGREEKGRDVGPSVGARDAPPEPPTPDENRRVFLACKSKYPGGLHRGDHWLLAEREIGLRLDEGTPGDALIGNTEAYCAQQEALGTIGTERVMRPNNFYNGSGAWRGPFPLPVAKSNRASDRITYVPEE